MILSNPIKKLIPLRGAHEMQYCALVTATANWLTRGHDGNPTVSSLFVLSDRWNISYGHCTNQTNFCKTVMVCCWLVAVGKSNKPKLSRCLTMLAVFLLTLRLAGVSYLAGSPAWLTRQLEKRLPRGKDTTRNEMDVWRNKKKSN